MLFDRFLALLRSWTDTTDLRSAMIRVATFTHDFLGAIFAAILAVAMGTPGAFEAISIKSILIGAGLFGLIASGIGFALGLNRGVWRYASIFELRALLASGLTAVAFWAFLLFLIGRIDNLSRTTIVLTAAFYVLLVGGSRLALRLFRDRLRYLQRRGNIRHGALFVGPADMADLFIRWTGDQGDLAYAVTGILDPRGRRAGRSIRGVPVLGGIGQLSQILSLAEARRALPRYIIIGTRGEEIAPSLLTDIVDTVASFGVSVLRVPDLNQVEGGTLAPQPFDIRELLSRPPQVIDTVTLASQVAGRDVLVTGAGGSIGSELCRQLIALEPRRLVLVDSNEFQLFNIDSELRRSRHADAVTIVPHLLDVRDRQRVAQAFVRHKPTFVFHAAALKHVPLVEAQPLEGLATNVLGTRNVVDAAASAGVKAMVFISTDKAVRPTSAMGLSKRVAEIYCQNIDLTSALQCVIVRFGNVLGSAGSIVPLFREQLASGGPLTVTHPQIERFLMTIPEASALVLHAASFAVRPDAPRGHVHCLDMGKPVKIMDLARRTIQLAGLRPDIDIEIKITGLRPGEKLYEELFTPDEQPSQASVAGILIAKPRPIAADEVATAIREIERANGTLDERAAVTAAHRIVPEYTPETRQNVISASSPEPDRKVIPFAPKT